MITHIKNIVAVSAIALITGTNAYAQTPYTAQSTTSTNAATAQDSTQPASTKMNSTLRRTEDVGAFILGDDSNAPVILKLSTTAKSMIGQDIVSPENPGDTIATVEDITLDKTGNPQKIIVSDGGLLGIGDKLAAFDYDNIISQKENGDVIIRISQDTIDRAADFSYDAADNSAAPTRGVAPEHLSLQKILDGSIRDSSGNVVASIENITFLNDKASHIVAGFDKTLGLGGKQAAFDFTDLQWNKDENGETSANLTTEQTMQFNELQDRAKGAEG